MSALTPSSTKASSTNTSSGDSKKKSSLSLGRIWDNYGMLVVFAVLFIACAIFVPNFFFCEYEGVRACYFDVRNGGVWHVVLPGVR